jgi:hypothetical protein
VTSIGAAEAIGLIVTVELLEKDSFLDEEVMFMP